MNKFSGSDLFGWLLFIDDSGLGELFEFSYKVQDLKSTQDKQNVLSKLPGFNGEMLNQCLKGIEDVDLPIKKLLRAAQLAKFRELNGEELSTAFLHSLIS